MLNFVLATILHYIPIWLTISYDLVSAKPVTCNLGSTQLSSLHSYCFLNTPTIFSPLFSSFNLTNKTHIIRILHSLLGLLQLWLWLWKEIFIVAKSSLAHATQHLLPSLPLAATSNLFPSSTLWFNSKTKNILVQISTKFFGAVGQEGGTLHPLHVLVASWQCLPSGQGHFTIFSLFSISGLAGSMWSPNNHYDQLGYGYDQGVFRWVSSTPTLMNEN